MSYQAVEYPPTQHPGYEGQPVIVRPLARNEALARAPQILWLVTSAYGEQFEGPDKLLPEGAFAERYSPYVPRTLDEPSALERARQFMIPPIYEQGGTYLAIFFGGIMAAYLKARHDIHTTADDPERRFEGMGEFAEMLTLPEFQRNGLASMLLHAYCRHGRISPAARVMLSAFSDNHAVNNFYRQLGFEPEQPTEPFMLGGLPMQYWVTPARVSVETIIRCLEERMPALADGVPIA